MNVTLLHRVDIMEFERGWGQRLDEKRYFATRKEAEDFVTSFNSKNNLDYVPDWYMIAEYVGKIQ